ncbi:MAG: hypothetical protein F6K42_32440 [Leptolyngbya sp. SIO1D8]|nr:hypothetical protein [Leptolyngbya sp. SIO1D8]
MIYVYAFCPSPSTPLAMPKGIAHPVVQVVSGGQLGAIAEFDLDVSQLKEDDQQLMDAVLSHDHVLGHLFNQTVLLPLRFGTQFKSKEALQNYLQIHQDTYLQRLEMLSNKAEYLVKLAPKSFPLSPINETLKGRAYFLAKKERLQAQTQAQVQQDGELQQFLAHLQTANVEFIQSASHEGEERLHILSMRDPAIAKAQLTHWQKLIPSWQIHCSQPLPPYHFA